ncbi:MAG: hypothetical protein M3R24_27185, partial [Chloroflexota bacterium]|nr:hypothetical protein [Chloroflexota bacterium]
DTDAAMRWTTTSYDALNRISSVTQPDGIVARERYFLQNGLLLHDMADGNRHRTISRSDSLGRRVRVDEFTGNCSSGWPGYECGGAFTTTWTINATTTYGYSPLDLLTSVTDAKSNVTSMRYDSLGRKVGMTDPDMGIWSYEYNVNNNLSKQTDAKGQSFTFQYDALNRLQAKRGSDGRSSYYGYDQVIGGSAQGKGHRTSMSVYVNDVHQSYQDWIYDARGRTLRELTWTSALNDYRTVWWAYDSADRVTNIRYPKDWEDISYTYDAAWRQTSICSWNIGCYATNATYTALDQPLSLTIGGTTQSWAYNNVMARLSNITVGTGTSLNRAYTYDKVGNVETIADNALGQTQTFRYDERDRLTRAWTTGSSDSAYDETYGYDTIGNLTAKTNNLNTVASKSYSYGVNGNGTGAGPHQARSVGGWSYSYDANGNLTDGQGRSYRWNADNLPNTIAQRGATELSWTAQELPHHVGRADGDGWSANVAQDATGYLQYGPYTTEVGVGDHQAVWKLQIDNNTANNEAVARVDVYDWTANTVLVQREITRQEWTAAGTPQEFALPFIIGSSQVGHQLEFRVWWHDTAAVKQTDLRVTASATEHYTYDADGERLTRTRNGETTLYVSGLWEEEIPSGTMRYQFALQGQVIGQRTVSSTSNTMLYLHNDHLGSVSMATDGSGTMVSQQDFTPWGEVRRGGMPQTSLNYTGQKRDDTGLLYYHARYYDPALSRFISADSIVPGSASGSMSGTALKPLTVDFHEPGFLNGLNGENRQPFWFQMSSQVRQQAGSPWGPVNAQALNRYSYVQNSPLKYTDPTGHKACAQGACYESTGGGVGGGCPRCGAPQQPGGASNSGAQWKNPPRSGRKNPLEPDPKADGPHTTYRRDPVTGEVIKYETWQPKPNRHPNDPHKWESEKRYNGRGGSHYNPVTRQDVKTPHVHDPKTPGGVRPPTPDEIP